MPAMQSGTIWALLYLAWQWLWNTLIRLPTCTQTSPHVWQIPECLFVKHWRWRGRFSPLIFKRDPSVNIGWPAGIKALLNHIKPLQIFKNETMTLLVWRRSSCKLFQVPYWSNELLRRGRKRKRKCPRGSHRTTTTLFAIKHGHDVTVLGAVLLLSQLWMFGGVEWSPETHVTTLMNCNMNSRLHL